MKKEFMVIFSLHCKEVKDFKRQELYRFSIEYGKHNTLQDNINKIINTSMEFYRNFKGKSKGRAYIDVFPVETPTIVVSGFNLFSVNKKVIVTNENLSFIRQEIKTLDPNEVENYYKNKLNFRFTHCFKTHFSGRCGF